MSSSEIPAIDIFAGPGGLSEGFSAFRTSDGTSPFRVRLSIEMDRHAHSTLKLRAFFRQFCDTRVPDEYYQHLRRTLSLEELYKAWPDQAKAADEEAWCAALGEVDSTQVRERIRQALNGAKGWALIGGPPCQAYSIVGRARRTNDADFEGDKKHLLYREYLRIIADHRPPVFVMENVKGLLSATLEGKSTFSRILDDLKRPERALGIAASGAPLQYRIYSLSKPVVGNGSPPSDPEFHPPDYVVACEDYGVPQARHRVILLGIRSDLEVTPRVLKPKGKKVKLWKVLSDLPRIRSGLSTGTDTAESWHAGIKSLANGGLIDGAIEQTVREEMERAIEKMDGKLSTGNEFMRCSPEPKYRKKWYVDPRLNGTCNHSARRHIREDLHRYLFVSSYGKTNKVSPKLRHFPAVLLPKHRNVKDAVRGSLFSDRFRVQLKHEPATTITSHIAKDGHYFIHPDPRQCRALTVREAARIQTFPDNYLFKGNRTQQYQQVGNAVPPLLAVQIAAIVHDVLKAVRIRG